MNSLYLQNLSDNYCVLKLYDRADAATHLAESLSAQKGEEGIIVGIPLGGAVIGFHLSQHLNLPFDMVFCKKIKHPSSINISIGSVSPDEFIVHEDWNDIPQDYISHQVAMIQHALKTQQKCLCGDRKPMPLQGKTVILTDDFISSPDSILVIINQIKKQQPRKIMVAVPVATESAAKTLRKLVDELIILIVCQDFIQSPEPFYVNFPKVKNEHILELMEKHNMEI